MSVSQSMSPKAEFKVNRLSIGIPDIRLERKLIDEISFIVPQGCILTILGASGCGKSTILRTLAGLNEPISGTIHCDFIRPGMSVGFQQQCDLLLPWQTIQENVALGLELRGLKKSAAQELALDMITQVGLLGSHMLYPHQISGGMLQRALLARTLATKPQLVLLDEPFSQLDLVAREELGTIVKKYVAESRSTGIIVTHSVEEAISLSDFILVISKFSGKTVARFSLTETENVEFLALSRAAAYQEVHSALLESCREAAVCV